MSAITEDGPTDGPHEIVKVLFTLHDGLDTIDFAGPCEVLHHSRHNIKDPSTRAFELTFAGASEAVTSAQGITMRAHIDFKEAHKRLKEFDVLVVPGGGSAPILKANAEPIALVKAFGELQKNDSARERTLLSVCTGSLFLAQAGVLQGFAATTHPDFYIQLEKLCQAASALVAAERTDVMEERYVVNNGRFDLGDIDENPFVISKEEFAQSRKERRRSSIARKGSNAWRESNKRRESNARRAALRLGGLRVITSGGISCGIDAALYLVCAMVSEESAHEVARLMQYNWQKGVVVDALDV